MINPGWLLKMPERGPHRADRSGGRFAAVRPGGVTVPMHGSRDIKASTLASTARPFRVRASWSSSRWPRSRTEQPRQRSHAQSPGRPRRRRSPTAPRVSSCRTAEAPALLHMAARHEPPRRRTGRIRPVRMGTGGSCSTRDAPLLARWYVRREPSGTW